MKAAIRVEPLTPARWADLEALFGAKGACAGCWCMFWRLEKGERFDDVKGATAKRRFKALVMRGEAQGLLAYLDGATPGAPERRARPGEAQRRTGRGGATWEPGATPGAPERRARPGEAERRTGRGGATGGKAQPVGWLAMGPRRDFAKLDRAPSLACTDADEVHSLPCFFIERGARGQGVATALLNAAVLALKKAGARVIEGYPVKPARPGEPIPAAFAYTGTVPLFEKAGFTLAAGKPAGKQRMRLHLPSGNTSSRGGGATRK